MGFLRPKAPAIVAKIPPPPKIPQVDPVKVSKQVGKKKKGYSETIMTSTKGDTSEPDIYKKTLLGA